MTAVDIRETIDSKLSIGYRLWNESGILLPADWERYIAVNELISIYNGPHIVDLAAACQCFHYFLKFHKMVNEYPTWATLLGDYFFSQFSKNLIPLDSVKLTDAFSKYLKSDISSSRDIKEYIMFIRDLPAVLAK